MGNFLEGNTRRIVSKAVELGEQDDLGTWDIRRGLRINELAGHGNLSTMIRLLTIPPLFLSAPPRKPAHVICIQTMGRLDVRANHQLPTVQQLKALVGAPQASVKLLAPVAMALPGIKVSSPTLTFTNHWQLEVLSAHRD